MKSFRVFKPIKMHTRTTDYSVPELQLKPFVLSYVKKLQKYRRQNKSKEEFQNVLSLNNILKYELNYFPLYSKITNKESVLNIEEKLKLNLKKIKHFKDSLFLQSFKETNKTVQYKEAAAILSKTCDLMRAKIYEYYHRKYICILFRTNSDIYRLILSFLIK